MAFLIGSFMPFIILLLLIIVHEIGHFITAIFFRIEVDKIYIYPFGGVSKFNISLNESLLKEFLILIMGPIFQIIFYFIIINIDYFNNYVKLITVYNYTILLFNLLPIYPLDGGKLLNILLSTKLSFRNSFDVSIIISYLTLLFISIYLLCKSLSLNIIVIISFLIFKISRELKKRKYIFDKFLLERYLNKYSFKKRKKVNSINSFMRGKYHLVKKDNKYYTEKTILENKFHNRY